ncbi:MAG: DUF6448 family protein [Nitrospirota bacterium]|jgi:hypothetical protein
MKPRTVLLTAGVFLASLFALPGGAAAHCDTLGGPVVAAAKTALETGDITPVLKWVRKEDEAEIREMFEKALAVRKKGPEARELADMYFFETLVRIHRAGEGAPYTGLKPAGAVEPAVEQADRALASGKVDGLVRLVTEAVREGIRERFQRAYTRSEHAQDSVAAGRAFVRAYVEFTHYVERLHMDATAHGGAETHEHHQ